MPHILDTSFASGARIHARAFAQAAADAGLAWMIAPTRHHFGSGPTRRPFTLEERLVDKIVSAKKVFQYSRWTANAPELVIQRRPREGLLANLLHVIEVLHRVRPDAKVHVDWTLDGKEKAFRYGAVGSDVWAGLFRPIGTAVRPGAFQPHVGIDLSLWGSGKDYLGGRALQNQRNSYHRTIAKWIEVSNQNVLARTHRIQGRFADHFCLGVHRRVGNSGVASLQKDGSIPALDGLVARCGKLLQASGDPAGRIFLATDDLEAAGAFKIAFGDRLIVQDDVKRTTASETEVHYRDWGALSLGDAEDVLVDTILLSRCNMLVHVCSSISTMASFLNPSLSLVRA